MQKTQRSLHDCCTTTLLSTTLSRRAIATSPIRYDDNPLHSHLIYPTNTSLHSPPLPFFFSFSRSVVIITPFHHFIISSLHHLIIASFHRRIISSLGIFHKDGDTALTLLSNYYKNNPQKFHDFIRLATSSARRLYLFDMLPR